TQDAGDAMMTEVRTERWNNLIRIASRLIALADRDIELLKAMRTRETAPLQAEKSAHTDCYEKLHRELAGDESPNTSQAPALKPELTALSARLEPALARNVAALDGMRAAHDRLLAAIVDAFRQDRAINAGYTRPNSPANL